MSLEGQGRGELAEAPPAGQPAPAARPKRYGFFRPRPHRGWHRWCRRLLEALLGIVAGVVILLGFAAWRLSEGPIPLNFLTPKLVKAFAAGGTEVSISQTLLVWDDARQSLDLRVRDLTLRDDDGGPGLILPESNLTLSIAALFRGEVQVVALKVLGADLRLTRLEDGSFLGLGGGEVPPAGDSGAESSPALGLIDVLLEEDADSPLAALEGIGLVDSTIVFDDRVNQQVWTLPAKQIDLRREPRGLSGEAELAVTLDDETAYVQVVFAYGKRRGLLDLSANVQQLSTTKLAKALPELAPLALIDTRVSGQVNVTLGQEADLGLYDFELQFGPGSLWLGGEGDPAIPLSGGSLVGFYDNAEDRLEVNRLLLHSGTQAAPGPSFTVEGVVARDLHGRIADLTVGIDSVSAGELTRYWPAAFAPGGRVWVAENILGGRIVNLEAKARLRVAAGPERPDLVVESLGGGFDFEDLSIAYLSPMPPATAVNGRATLGLDALDFQATQATVEGMAFDPVSVQIYGLSGDEHRLRLATRGKGGVAALFALLDHPRLGLLGKLGLPYAGVSGQAEVSLGFDFSLRGEVTFEQIETETSATFTDLTLPSVWQGEALSARQLDLTFDGKQLRVQGGVNLAGAAFDTDWVEPVGGGERRIKAKSPKVAVAALQKLLPALAGRLDGSLALTLDLRGNPAGRASVAVEADLTQARFTLPDIELDKAPGEAASARFTARIEKGHVLALEKVAVQAPGFVASGTLSLGPDGDIAAASLTQLTALGQTLGAVEATPLAGGGWSLRLQGGTLDARQWIKMGQSDGDERAESPLRIADSRLDQILLPGGALGGVTLALTRDAQGIAAIQIAGTLSAGGKGGGRLSLSLAPEGDGRRAFALTADDMGALLRALDITDSVVGGSLQIQAKAQGPERQSRFEGTVEGTSFGLIDAPTFARMLGMNDESDTEGYPFERLTGSFAWEQGVLSTPLIRAYGGSLGITTKGSLDFRSDVIDLEGTVVPAYTIYRVIGQIPLIGWIITGGEDGGFLAVTYSVTGTISAPKVSANPLSAITPGFLRGLFGLLEDDGSVPPPSLYPEPPNR